MKLSDIIATNIIDISQVNMKGLIRDMKEKEAIRLLKQVMENNIMILKLQKQLLELQKAEKQKRRREQEKEWRRRKYDKDRRKKNKEKEKRKRLNDE